MGHMLPEINLIWCWFECSEHQPQTYEVGTTTNDGTTACYTWATVWVKVLYPNRHRI